MNCRGIRGAITVEENEPTAILAATSTLLQQIITANQVTVADVASVIFTATADLDAAYPAQAARKLGWTQTPLLCMQEMATANSLPRCIRVLLHWNTDRSADEIIHIYLGQAKTLRPDLTQEVIA